MDFMNHWSLQTGIATHTMLRWAQLGPSKFYDWRKRYGRVNEHNASVPRDFWLLAQEKEAIIDSYTRNPGEGYRRLTYMMMDADIVAVSPTSVWRVLREAGMLHRWNRKPTKKGTGFRQPKKPHAHWHMDISYVNISGTFYYLCTVLDGYSRYIVHWDIRPSMAETDVELILQKARENVPDAAARIITDNGPQFIARDFKEFIRISGMTHVRTSPYYPQSNGKLERWHQSLKRECIRPGTPLNLDDARRIIARYVHYYNTVRLHSAIGYITPADKLAGNENRIFSQRDEKLERARENRRQMRLALHASNHAIIPGKSESSSLSGKVFRNSDTLHFTLN